MRSGPVEAGTMALALLICLGASKAQAQLLDGTVHEVKISASAMAYVPMVGLVKEGGKDTSPAVLRSMGANPVTGGFDYAVNLLIDTGPGACLEHNIATLTTYTGEEVGIVQIDVADYPEPGLSMFGRLFAKIQTKAGKAGVKTVAGWVEVLDGMPPEPEGISKSVKFQAKEKDAAKLVECTVP